jgi:methylenetetrahydrofolate reductase (NADPH)
MKIVDKIAQKSAEGKPFYSFEYFPPKTTQVSSEELFWKAEM